MNKFKKFININNYITTSKMIMAWLISKLINSRKKIWLISERPDQARDNGYCFFKYLREEYPKINAYYIIKKEAIDKKKIEQYGNIIDYDSWKHYLYFCVSKIHISAHDDMCAPSNTPIVKHLRKKIGYKNIFLPHGVSYGISEFCLAKYNKYDLFICSGKQEYDNLKENFGYKKNQLAYTGFPRLDSWHSININKSQILLMPTWRAYLAQDNNTIIENTNFFKRYQSLINNQKLSNYLKENNKTMIFYLHDSMKQFANAFKTDSENIEVVYDDKKYDIQELLKESALLITDYSSVHFDFAYMNKPVIYYQFDQKEFQEKQYAKGLFDVEQDGFGPVVYEEDKLVDELIQSINTNFIVKEKYHKNMRQFYQIYDDRNCDRVLNVIKDLENNG